MTPDTTRAPLPLGVALIVAAAAGPILDASFPDRGWWPLAIPAVALALLAAQGRRPGAALLVGLVFGAAFYFPHIEWATLFLGPIPWSALSTLMALWVMIGTAAISLVYRWAPRVWSGPAGRLLLVPAIVAGLWTAREAIASVWPYGGFSWGRVAFSQSESPVAPLFAWLGVSGVSFVLVFLAAAGLAFAQEAWRVVAAGRRLEVVTTGTRVAALRLGTAYVALVLVALVFPAFPSAADGTIRVAAVQGNGKTSYFDPPERTGDNLLAQVAATEPTYGDDVDVVVWPEGGSDLDPLRSASAARIFDEVSELSGAPLVSGIITARLPEGGDPETDTEYFNTAVVWRDGEGVGDYYDKKHPVPFGEYVPDRDFWRQFAPDLIDLIGREYTPGTTDTVLELDDGLFAGVAICFDIVDDQIMTDTVREGADLVFAPTNNADFGRTDESLQQLAIARIRAIELGRSVVNISTVGTSAIFAPDGRTLDQLTWFTADAMVVDVPLGTSTTPAVTLGRQIEWGVSALGLAGLVLAAVAGRRAR